MAYSNKLIEELLQSFCNVTASDHLRYRNHVYRVFLNCIAIDKETDNEEKYAVAAVFHDIGIWTNNTIDYLKPSIEQAKNFLIKTGRQSWVEEISLMIYWHHKTSAYTGAFEQTVETFRRADYIDVTLGLFNYGLNKKEISQNKKHFPNAGFHVFLIKRIVKNVLRHPLNPLPMFTR